MSSLCKRLSPALGVCALREVVGNRNDVGANAAEKIPDTGWINMATFPFEELVSDCRNDVQRHGRSYFMVTKDEFL